nr:nucleotidyl transferase AbiEii/AbiGii toxin family protein [Bradyrhizobium sp. 76]
MDKVALLDGSERSALFGETGAARGVANTVIEKDFWVCWTLKRLFELQDEEAPTLIFKGGTSLSKAFGAIRRFSEDLDLSFDVPTSATPAIVTLNRKASAGSRPASSSTTSSGMSKSTSSRS